MRRFAAYGRPATFRMSPLASPLVDRFLEEKGWESFGHSCVMHLNLTRMDLSGSLIHIPTKDLSRFIGAAMQIRGFDASLRPGVTEIISSIKAETGLFLIESDGRPVSTAIIAHEGDLAGLFEIGTLEGERGKGHARAVITAALKWARSRGARRAWLQVEQDNLEATALYASMGFRAVYDYYYRREPGA
jgi:GNAT superfamily N-acetyltransferase